MLHAIQLWELSMSMLFMVEALAASSIILTAPWRNTNTTDLNIILYYYVI